LNKYLYIGCGNHRLKGFVHVDIDFSKHTKNGTKVSPPEILCDITQNIPIKDNEVDLIFARETHEHLKYRELINSLIECHRILKVGGLVRFCVPDLDQYTKKFLEKTEDLNLVIKQWDLDPDFPIENHSELFNARIMYHDHFYNHNFETFSNCLLKSGFHNIIKSAPGDIKIKNQIIKDSISDAENDKFNENKEYLLIVTAEKISNTSIPKIKITKKRGLINSYLNDFLNLKITPYNHRKPHIFKKEFFLEILFNLKKKIKSYL
jgi:predicted SAM-dependent methyltransferase